MQSDTQVLSGPYTLGRYGVWVNLVGFLFLVYNCITFNFPTISPVDSENMNYTSAAVGIIMLISLVTWVTTGRKSFSGPEGGRVMSVVHHAVEGDPTTAKIGEAKEKKSESD
jgi:choline transport protein